MSEYVELVDLVEHVIEEAQDEPQFNVRNHAFMGAGKIHRQWLPAHDRKVKAEALREAADTLVREFPMRWALTGKYPYPGRDAEQAENAANVVISALRTAIEGIEE